MIDARAGSPLDFSRNVFLDTASAHRWEALNEHVFVRRVLVALRAELGERFAQFTFFVFSPAHAGVTPASADIVVPGKVLLFLSDESSSVPHALGPSYHTIFKAYLPRDQPGTNIFPFSVGYVGAPDAPLATPVLDRPIDVFFSGNLNANRLPLYRAYSPLPTWLPRLDGPMVNMALRSPLRHVIRRDFSADRPGFRSYVRFTDGFKTGLASEAYAAMLATSKIVLCPRGFVSTETFRHVEALRAGAIIASEPLPDTHLYRHGPFLRVDDWRRGLADIARLVTDRDALLELQARSLSWYHLHLSEVAMARFMAHAIVNRGYQ